MRLITVVFMAAPACYEPHSEAVLCCLPIKTVVRLGASTPSLTVILAGTLVLKPCLRLALKVESRLRSTYKDPDT